MLRLCGLSTENPRCPSVREGRRGRRRSGASTISTTPFSTRTTFGLLLPDSACSCAWHTACGRCGLPGFLIGSTAFRLGRLSSRLSMNFQGDGSVASLPRPAGASPAPTTAKCWAPVAGRSGTHQWQTSASRSWRVLRLEFLLKENAAVTSTAYRGRPYQSAIVGLVVDGDGPQE